MSMLLDALKKSEEQRRLRAKPDISRDTPGHQRDAADPLRQWLPLALVVISVMTMAWFGWQQFRPPAVVSEEPQVAVRAVSPQPAETASGEAVLPVQESDARTPVAEFSAPPAAESETAAAAAPDEAQREQVRRSFSQYEAPSGAVAAGETGGETTAQQEPAQQEPASPRTASTRRSEPYQPEAMSYWELPQGVRDSLPEFKVMVLVYAENPEDRFLLVNGVRLKEKDELQSGVVLDEIRRDGAVFRARNYRFLVKG